MRRRRSIMRMALFNPLVGVTLGSLVGIYLANGFNHENSHSINFAGAKNDLEMTKVNGSGIEE